MGGSSTQTQSSRQTYTPDPYAYSAYKSLFPEAQKLYQTPYNPATESRVAGFTPQQLQAFQGISNLQGAYQPYIDTAKGYITAGAAPIQADAIRGYMNPYTEDVVKATMANLAENQALQQKQVLGNAIAQGALGGGMTKAAQAELARTQGLATGQTLADLRSGAYDRALAAAQSDAQRKLVASQQMQGLGTESQRLGLEGLSALYGAGAAQQQQQQNVYDIATQNAQQRTLWPYQQLGYLSSIYGGIGPLMGGTTYGTATGTSGSGGKGSMLGPVLSGLSLFSDERLKEDIEPVGKTFDGQNIYKYRFKGDGPTRIGLLAQEVADKHPEAVSSANGMMMVDYDKATRESAVGSEMADGGGVQGIYLPPMKRDLFSIPVNKIQTSQPIIPSVSSSLGKQASAQSPSQTLANLEQWSKLGEKARSGLGNLFDKVSGISLPTSLGKGSGGTVGGFADGGSIGGWPQVYEPDQLTFAQILNNYLASKTNEATPYPAETGGRSAEELFRTAETMPGVSIASAPGQNQAVVQEQPAQPGIGGIATQQQAGGQPLSTALGGILMEPGSYLGIPAPSGMAGNMPVPAATSNAGQNPAAQAIQEEFSAAGMSPNGIRGILVNARDESGFNPASRHADQPRWSGEAHYAHGLFQMGGREWNNYSNWLAKNYPDSDWKDPRLQSRFQAWNLRTNYPSVWEKMNEGSAEQASQAFLSGYLKPAERYRQERSARYGSGIPALEELLGGAAREIGSGIGAIGQGVTSAGREVAGGISGLVNKAGEVLSKGFRPSGQKFSYQSEQDQNSGGLLQRIFGINFNPLNLTPAERLAMLRAGAVMMSTGDIGKGIVAGTDTLSAQSKQANQARFNQMKLDIQRAQLMKPVPGPKTTDLMGRQTQGMMQYNPLTGAWEPMAVPGNPVQGVQGAPQAQVQMGVHGEEFLNASKFGPQERSLIKSLADYKLPISQFRRLQSNAQLMAAVSQYDPSFSAGNYDAAKAANRKMAAGSWADVQVAANKAVNHTTALIENVPGLENFRSSLGNIVTGTVSEQYNKPYQLALGKVRTNKLGVSGELAKVFKGVGATSEQEIKEWKENFSEYSGPVQIIAAAQEGLRMMMGQLDPLAAKINAERNKVPGDRGYVTGRDLMDADTRARYDMIMSIDPEDGAAGVTRAFGKKATQNARGSSNTYAKTTPQVGEIRKGYRFVGGDPASPDSWERVQ